LAVRAEVQAYTLMKLPVSEVSRRTFAAPVAIKFTVSREPMQHAQSLFLRWLGKRKPLVGQGYLDYPHRRVGLDFGDYAELFEGDRLFAGPSGGQKLSGESGKSSLVLLLVDHLHGSHASVATQAGAGDRTQLDVGDVIAGGRLHLAISDAAEISSATVLTPLHRYELEVLGRTSVSGGYWERLPLHRRTTSG